MFRLDPQIRTVSPPGKGISPIIDLLTTVYTLNQEPAHPIYIMHICSHSQIPGPLAQGNVKVDRLVASSFPDANSGIN